MGVDFEGLMRYLYDPGQLLLSYGPRKDGKTHTAVAFNEWNVKHRPEFHVLTNVPFMRVKGFQDGRPVFEKGYPDRVQLVQSFEDIFRATGRILEKDLDSVISIPMDEMQNYALAETGSEDMNINLNRWAGIIRKFQQIPHGMTPVYANIPKRWRHFADDPTYGGNVTCLIFKDRALTEEYNRRTGSSFAFKQLAWVQDSFLPQDVKRDRLEGREPLEIPVTSWTKPWEKPEDWKRLKEGDCFFNHRSSANLDVGGPGFDFSAFLRAVSGVLHFDVPAVINSFFERLDKQREAMEEENSIPAIVKRLRDGEHEWDPVKWDQIEFAFRQPKSTLQSQIKRLEREGRWAET